MKKTGLLIVFVLTNITLFAQFSDIEAGNVVGFTNNTVNSISVQTDNKKIICGAFTTYNNGYPMATDNRIVRTFAANSGRDITFNAAMSTDPKNCFTNTAYTSFIQPDGKIMIGGAFDDYNDPGGIHTPKQRLVRLNSDGTFDNTFITGAAFQNGVIYAIALQSDGKILVGGSFTIAPGGVTRNCMVRLNANGSLDNTFNIGTGFNGYVKTIKIQTDGKVLVGGTFNTYKGIAKSYIVRINTDGSIDNTFSIGTGFNGVVNTIVTAFFGEDYIIVGGAFTSYNGVAKNRIIALKQDGSVGLYFTEPGFNGTVNTLFLTKDSNKLLVGGNFTQYVSTTTTRNNIAVIGYATGQLESAFNNAGFNGEVRAIAEQADGKIIIGGTFTQYNGLVRNNLVAIGGETSLSTADFSKNNISLYPNPVKEILNISLSESTRIKSYEIYDFLGKKIVSKNTTENYINVSNLSNGIYILKVTSSEGIMTNKFIKE
jgi:uncharacterized delta-60 repeat protein